jgi:predicted tellurium resistance membrane protein TerC
MSFKNQMYFSLILTAAASLLSATGVTLVFRNSASHHFEPRRIYILTCIVGVIVGIAFPWIMAVGAFFGLPGITLLLFYVSYKLSTLTYAFYKRRFTL